MSRWVRVKDLRKGDVYVEGWGSQTVAALHEACSGSLKIVADGGAEFTRRGDLHVFKVEGEHV